MSIRIAKFISDTGFASRREAEKLIESGFVSVNGEIINTPVFFLQGDEDVKIKGISVKQKSEIQLYAFHKPVNTVTTTNDPNGRETIYDVLPKKYRNLKYVGRLDYKTSGLLLMTNDGDFAGKITSPSAKIPRVYIAKLYPKKMDEIKSPHVANALRKFLSPIFSDDSIFDSLRRGIVIDKIKYAPIEIEIISRYPLTVQLTLIEGKKNEIRIVMDYLGLPVKKLHRISYGNIKIENLQEAEIVEISKKNIDELMKSI